MVLVAVETHTHQDTLVRLGIAGVLFHSLKTIDSSLVIVA